MRRVASFLILGAAFASASDMIPLTGTVTDALTGEPLRHATVGVQFLSGVPSTTLAQSVTADAAGRFEFPSLSAGKYVIWAERRGYCRLNSTQDVGANNREVSLRLTPYSAVIGQVVDENGDPLIGVNIQVLRSTVSQGQRSLQPASSAVTNDLGMYRAAQLPPGRYYVSATARQGAPAGVHYGTAYYSGAAEFSSAIPLELAPGTAARADFHLEPVSTFSIRGNVSDRPAEANIIAALTPAGAADTFNTISYNVRVAQDTGEFEIKDVPSGHYLLNATAFRGGGGDRAFGLEEISVGKADLEGVTITFRKPAQVTGSLRIEDPDHGSPLDPTRVNVTLRPREAGFRPQPSARLLPDKTFVITEVMPGDYTLQVNVPAPFFLKSALFGGVDANSSPLSIGAGATPPPLDLVIGSKGGELNGVVMKGDRPAANCTVLLSRRGGSFSQEKLGGTDAQGHFQFTAIAPGDYTAYAFDSVNDLEYRNPEVLQRYLGENVSVAEDGRASVQLKWNAP